MEVRHIFNREILSVMEREMTEIYLVRSGRLVLVDRDEKLLASFGPSTACGLEQVISGLPLPGNLMASGTTSVLALERQVILDELQEVDGDIKKMLTSLQLMLKREHHRI